MADDALTAMIGDNKPPLTEQIALQHEALFKRIEDLFASCGRVPATIENDEVQAAAQDLLKMIRVIPPRVKVAQAEALEPLATQVAQVKAVFTNRLDPLLTAAGTLNEKVTAYLKKKADAKAAAAAAAAKRAATDAEAERHERTASDRTSLSQTRSDLGTVASLSKRTTYEVEDFSKLPVDLLWPLISEEDKRIAVGKLVRGGATAIPGVRIFEVEKAVVR